MDTEVFFPLSDAAALDAQLVCADCPVLTECAAWALRAGVTDGVVASVWLPGLNGRRGLPAMRRRLMRVAATGRPDTEDARREVA
ncbi:WhiB family transcriptional regulator [Nocardia otitidiscaviarum]|nr:WhiB family transcriptional regulator [Nocardia otitidiscaviarum]MCP9619681.1 WhiB family transcriptional regulator [Nocardia otitidiscaviarum]